MKLFSIVAIFVLVILSVTPSSGQNSSRIFAPPSLDDNLQAIAQFINSINTTWKAHESVNKQTAFPSLGLLQSSHVQLPMKVHDISDKDELPEEFDSRQKWPECSDIINRIRDQGACGSCWAQATASVASDRICIHSKGAQKVHISAEDLTDCCSNLFCQGCSGGNLVAAFYHYKHHGIVSGGLFQSHEGCKPYSFRNCSHHSHGSLPQCSRKHLPTPKCVRQCESGYPKTYEQDRHFGSSFYGLLFKSEKQIMAEIFKNGPVTTGFAVFADFLTYKSGVYKRHSWKILGGHAVRIIGWGVENSVKFWLVANSWNREWGEKGFFKILRGENECAFESLVVAGLPKL